MNYSFKQIKTGKNIAIITKSVINSIPKTRLFDSDSKRNDILYKLHQDLLNYSMRKNNSREVGILWNIITNDRFVFVGTENGISLSSNSEARNLIETYYNNSLVFVHNHPRNGLFSYKDIQSFCDYSTILAVTAVCNDGRIHILRKEINFNPDVVKIVYSEAKEHGKSGVNEVIKNASKLGILYRCSVPNKKGGVSK